MEDGKPLPFDSFITFLHCRDLTATAEFYEGLLGLPLVLDQGGCRIYRVSREGHLGFCEREASPAPEGVILTLVTDDVDVCFARLRDAGVQIDREPALNPEYGIYHCFVRDPDGHIVEIQRFEDPRWADRNA